MKKRYVVYIILEALIVASLVYMFGVINRLPVADSIASINHDITLSKDAYISDAGITLAKGTTVKPTVIVNAKEVTFYTDGYDGRLSLDVEYFVEKEDLINLYEQQTSKSKDLKKDMQEKDLLFSAVGFVVYLLVSFSITWLFRERAHTLAVHRVITVFLIVAAVFMHINIF
ncbi:MAG: hypothetical protein SPL61_12565 [Saccharofermentans sp.]|nr:hypothetical protein [Saccharofermentans sp.]